MLLERLKQKAYPRRRTDFSLGNRLVIFLKNPYICSPVRSSRALFYYKRG